jgi:hypothetical protein
LTALAWAADDPKPDQPEPPVELKKKKRPDSPDDKPMPKDTAPKKDAEPKKDGEPKKGGDPKDDPPPAPAEDDKQILERINKNLKEAEERLKKKDTGDATRQTQKDIVIDLEALIKQSEQQQAQNQPQGGASSNSKNSKDQASGKSSRSKRSSSGNSERQPGDSSQTKQGNGNGNSSQGGAGKNGGDGVDKLADVYKEQWGNLPETLRMAMDVYSREQFMSKYSELLKQYYSTIAERKRRGEEDK